MNNEGIDVNSYSIRLMNDRKFLKSEYRKYVDNCYAIEDITGNMHCDVLYSYLKAAKSSRRLRSMLCELLWYINAESMSNANFKMVLKLSSRYRNTYVSVMAHHSLAFYQMQILNTYPQSFEAFAWLFDKICRYDCFTENDMYQILVENNDTTKFGVQQCIESASKKYGESEKLHVAANWVSGTD